MLCYLDKRDPKSMILKGFVGHKSAYVLPALNLYFCTVCSSWEIYINSTEENTKEEIIKHCVGRYHLNQWIKWSISQSVTIKPHMISIYVFLIRISWLESYPLQEDYLSEKQILGCQNTNKYKDFVTTMKVFEVVDVYAKHILIIFTSSHFN